MNEIIKWLGPWKVIKLKKYFYRGYHISVINPTSACQGFRQIWQ